MRSKTFWLFTSVIAVCLILFGWNGYGQKRATPGAPIASATPRPAWEHAVIEIDNLNQGEKILTEFGAQGWELVTVQAAGNEMGGGYYYFKRPK